MGLEKQHIPFHMFTYRYKNANPTSNFLKEADPIQMTFFLTDIWVYSQQCQQSFWGTEF